MTIPKPGIIKSIHEFLSEASESNPITKEQILAKLVARFPDRSAESMRSTVNQQVPNKLREAGYVVKKNQSGYWSPESSNSTNLPPQTIRIDAEVWRALQKLAEPFVETPNDVLRRLLGLTPG